MSTIAEHSCLDRDETKPCFRARVARRIAGRIIGDIPVRITMPDGTIFSEPESGDDVPSIDLIRPTAFFTRLGHLPKIGFGEAYMAGDWQPSKGTDLADALMPFAAHITNAVPGTLQRLRTFVEERVPHHQRNTLHGSKKNIEAHYDLSNDLFAAFLDPSLSYSSALFKDEIPSTKESFEEAQHRKVDAALDKAGVTKGTKLLEIGTGWGTLAIRAAQRGATVTTVTLSNEQAALAKERAADAGVADLIDIRIQDYRHVEGTFDAIVSIEMIEAVGDEYWQEYFDTIDSLLADGGIAVVQAILMSHDRYLATRRSFSWIQKHIFPGGIIPSVTAIEKVTAKTSLEITDQHHFGLHYAETLRRWRNTFTKNWPQITKLGFDEEFKRMWEFYLSYSRSGFATGYLDVAQFQFQRRSN